MKDRTQTEIAHLQLLRWNRKHPLNDAYGLPVSRGDSLNLCPIHQRWSLWKDSGWLGHIIPKNPGWRAWKDEQSPHDRQSPILGITW